MPRKRRAIEPDHPHHVVLRGNNRRRLFSYKRDRRRFLVLLREGAHREEVQVHSVTLMTNHVHLLVTPPRPQALSMMIKRAAQRYASERNRRQGGTGKLFEERFYCQPIRNDDHLGLTQAYIETNAKRAGICESVDEFEWSTLGLHTGRGRAIWNKRFRDWVVPSGWYLALGPDDATRRVAYRAWIELTLRAASEPKHWDAVRRIEERRGSRPRRPDGTSAA